MSIPTRTQIADKITEYKESPIAGQTISDQINDWLDTLNCPADDKGKILDDLISYDEYQ